MTQDLSVFATQISRVDVAKAPTKQDSADQKTSAFDITSFKGHLDKLGVSPPSTTSDTGTTGDTNDWTPSQIKINADLNHDGMVDMLDLNMMIKSLGMKDKGGYDLNSDGVQDQKDVNILNALWGTSGEMVISNPDVNNDGMVNATDLNEMLENYGSDNTVYDLNNDGVNDQKDVDMLLAFWSDTNTETA